MNYFEKINKLAATSDKASGSVEDRASHALNTMGIRPGALADRLNSYDKVVAAAQTIGNLEPEAPEIIHDAFFELADQEVVKEPGFFKRVWRSIVG